MGNIGVVAIARRRRLASRGRSWPPATRPPDACAATASACLIETAKANGLKPYAYLRHLFAELPKAQTLGQIEALLSFHVKTQQLTPTPS